MPIKSYLAYPAPGRSENVALSLAALEGCDVYPALNQELLILITDTPDEPAEAWLEEQLQIVPDLQCLALVSGMEPNLIQIESAREAVC